MSYYGSNFYRGKLYYGYAYTSFNYTYTPGTSVKITLSATEIRQVGDRINYYLSFDGGSTYRQIRGNITYYPSTESASQTVYVKVEFITQSERSAPSVQDISITVSGYVSLYSLARTVIKQFDASSGLIGENYTIADELGAISIPNAYLEPQSYKSALNLICNAGASRAYAQRDGSLVIERVDRVVDTEIMRDADSYFLSVNQSNPQELVNRVTVTINPLTRASVDEEIAALSDTAAVGDTEYTIKFTTDPCDGVSFTIPESGVSVSSSTVYTWGADITVTNSNGTPTAFNLTVDGRPYRVEGAYKVQLDDSESIRRSGVQELAIDNPLIQNKEQADDIMTLLIASFKNQKRLVESDIVPDPSVGISDGIAIDNKAYKVYNNDMAYSETGLTQVISGVKQ